MNDPAFIFLMAVMAAMNTFLLGVVITRINKLNKQMKMKEERWYALQYALNESIHQGRAIMQGKSASIRSIAE